MRDQYANIKSTGSPRKSKPPMTSCHVIQLKIQSSKWTIIAEYWFVTSRGSIPLAREAAEGSPYKCRHCHLERGGLDEPMERRELCFSVRRGSSQTYKIDSCVGLFLSLVDCTRRPSYGAFSKFCGAPNHPNFYMPTKTRDHSRCRDFARVAKLLWIFFQAVTVPKWLYNGIGYC